MQFIDETVRPFGIGSFGLLAPLNVCYAERPVSFKIVGGSPVEPAYGSDLLRGKTNSLSPSNRRIRLRPSRNAPGRFLRRRHAANWRDGVASIANEEGDRFLTNSVTMTEERESENEQS